MKTSVAPIVLFVYNRPYHTRQTIDALQKNELANESELFIYSDAAKNESSEAQVQQVRQYIKSIDGFKKVTIIEREKNWGLANSIIDGVTKVVNEYGKIIVLEDDLVTSPYFLSFMNDGLCFYRNDYRVFSLTGFSFEKKFMNFPHDYLHKVYMNIRPMSWSWATWKDRWVEIDWEIKDYNDFINNKKRIKDFNKGGTDLTNMLKNQMEGKIDSWYIRWTYNAYRKKKYTIYPIVSFVNNLGFDASGTHCGVDSRNLYNHTELCVKSDYSFVEKILIDKRIVESFNQGFNLSKKSRLILFFRDFLYTNLKFLHPILKR